MSTELTAKSADGIDFLVPTDRKTEIDECLRVSNIFAQSGFYSDATGVAQSFVKMLAGREMGFGYFASQNGVYIISTGGQNGREKQVKVAISSTLMAAAVLRAGYKYRIIEHTPKVCTLGFFDRDGSKLGLSTFTIEDAAAAGLIKDFSNWKKYPRNMVFARAMSNGVKWFCPDVFAGPVYVPDELGADVDEYEVPIDVTPKGNGHADEVSQAPQAKPQSEATNALQAKLEAKRNAQAPTPAQVAELVHAGPGDGPGVELYDTVSDLGMDAD